MSAVCVAVSAARVAVSAARGGALFDSGFDIRQGNWPSTTICEDTGMICGHGDVVCGHGDVVCGHGDVGCGHGVSAFLRLF